MSNEVIKSGSDLIGTSFPDALVKTGLTPEYMAKKMKGFAEAKTPEGEENYTVQVKGVDMLNRCQGNYQDKMQIEPVRQLHDKLEGSIIEKIKGGAE